MVEAIKEANFIWKEYLVGQISEDDEERQLKFYNYIKENHKDFYEDYEIIIYFMSYLRSYNKSTFKYYLKNYMRSFRKEDDKDIFKMNLVNKLYVDAFIDKDNEGMKLKFRDGVKKYYPDLIENYNLIFNYIIELQMYNEGVFRYYLRNWKDSDITTPEGTIIHANFIYREYKSCRMNISDENLEKIHKFILKEHKTFGKSYPIVLKYMVYMGRYTEKALKYFLMYWRENPPSGRDEYHKVWAKYPHYLYKFEDLRNYKKEKGQQIEKEAYKLLVKEFEDWQTALDEAEKKYEEDRAKSIDNRKKELLEFIKNKKELNL